MIHFDPPPEPPDFKALVEQPGKKWLATHPSGRPRDYWSRVKDALAEGFRYLCAYGAMFEPVGTVDHFVSCSEDRSRAYDWSNYRYAAAWINSSKQDLSSEQLLDPFQVMDGWFRVLLPSLQLVPTDKIPPKERARAEFMIERLHLRDDERIIRQRREWYPMYQERELTLEGLRKKAPLIARAVEEQLAQQHPVSP
jgi:hypothetical protein